MTAVHKATRYGTVCGLRSRKVPPRKLVHRGWVGVNCLNCIRRFVCYEWGPMR